MVISTYYVFILVQIIISIIAGAIGVRAIVVGKFGLKRSRSYKTGFVARLWGLVFLLLIPLGWATFFNKHETAIILFILTILIAILAFGVEITRKFN